MKAFTYRQSWYSFGAPQTHNVYTIKQFYMKYDRRLFFPMLCSPYATRLRIAIYSTGERCPRSASSIRSWAFCTTFLHHLLRQRRKISHINNNITSLSVKYTQKFRIYCTGYAAGGQIVYRSRCILRTCINVGKSDEKLWYIKRFLFSYFGVLILLLLESNYTNIISFFK